MDESHHGEELADNEDTNEDPTSNLKGSTSSAGEG
jgi:hypothetical protein